jgi:uncharacterized membrane protein
MSETLIGSPGGILATLSAICASWFYVEQVTERKLLKYAPPLLFIYATPVILTNTVVSCVLVHQWSSPDAWKGSGSLTGSWIGGAGNMTAATEMLATPPELFSAIGRTYGANRGGAVVH